MAYIVYNYFKHLFCNSHFLFAGLISHMASELYIHFTHINSVDVWSDWSHFYFTAVNPNTVCNKLKYLKSKKASGFDNISPRFLKIGAQALSETLTPIINNSITSSKYPDYVKGQRCPLCIKSLTNLIRLIKDLSASWPPHPRSLKALYVTK